HTVRDPERWYDSTAETIYRATNSFPPWVLTLFPMLGRFADLQERLIWERIFNGRFSDRSYAIDIFNQYTNEVRQHVPPEKLLVFQVKEGWEPLCAFLDVPLPDLPFPHVNDREVMRRRLKMTRFVFTKLPLILAGLLGLLGLWYWRHRNKSKDVAMNEGRDVAINE
ncbi:hypothetical protein MNBD_CHLOROFLEXI01-4979, partial [hydrothermal vent metagenome]